MKVSFTWSVFSACLGIVLAITGGTMMIMATNEFNQPKMQIVMVDGSKDSTMADYNKPDTAILYYNKKDHFIHIKYK